MENQLIGQTKEMQELAEIVTPCQYWSLSGSSVLKKFTDTFPEVLTTPTKYLGSNFQAVLDFWFYLDSLSKQEQVEISYCLYDLMLDHQSFLLAIDTALDSAKEVFGWSYSTIAGQAIKSSIGFESYLFLYATCELIGDVENKVFYNLVMSQKFYNSILIK